MPRRRRQRRPPFLAAVAVTSRASSWEQSADAASAFPRRAGGREKSLTDKYQRFWATSFLPYSVRLSVRPSVKVKPRSPLSPSCSRHAWWFAPQIVPPPLRLGRPAQLRPARFVRVVLCGAMCRIKSKWKRGIFLDGGRPSASFRHRHHIRPFLDATYTLPLSLSLSWHRNRVY